MSEYHNPVLLDVAFIKKFLRDRDSSDFRVWSRRYGIGHECSPVHHVFLVERDVKL